MQSFVTIAFAALAASAGAKAADSVPAPAPVLELDGDRLFSALRDQKTHESDLLVLFTDVEGQANPDNVAALKALDRLASMLSAGSSQAPLLVAQYDSSVHAFPVGLKAHSHDLPAAILFPGLASSKEEQREPSTCELGLGHHHHHHHDNEDEHDHDHEGDDSQRTALGSLIQCTMKHGSYPAEVSQLLLKSPEFNALFAEENEETQEGEALDGEGQEAHGAGQSGSCSAHSHHHGHEHGHEHEHGHGSTCSHPHHPHHHHHHHHHPHDLHHHDNHGRKDEKAGDAEEAAAEGGLWSGRDVFPAVKRGITVLQSQFAALQRENAVLKEKLRDFAHLEEDHETLKRSFKVLYEACLEMEEQEIDEVESTTTSTTAAVAGIGVGAGGGDNGAVLDGSSTVASASASGGEGSNKKDEL